MLRSLFILALALLASSAGVQAQSGMTAECQGTTETIPSLSTGTSGPFLVGTGVIVTEQNNPIDPFTLNKDVVSLSVTLGASKSCSGGSATPGTGNIQIALYSPDSTGMFIREAFTENIALTQDQVANGATISRAVNFPNTATVKFGQSYFIAVGTDNSHLCLQGVNSAQAGSFSGTGTYSPTVGLPAQFTATSINGNFEASTTVCTSGTVVGDPVFTGFHGQQFTVKGEAGSVFNLISSPTLTFNNRFISLASEEESMSTAAMKEVRTQVKASKLKALVKGIPPVTAAWNHPGTYMGESGITLGDSQLYVAPGAYATGFSTVTLNGEALAISSTPVELDGDMTVTRPSAFKLVIATRDVKFTLINSDKFINIEHAKVLSADAQLTGLLGQTADAAWEVVQSAEFTQHVEADYKVASNKLF